MSQEIEEAWAAGFHAAQRWHLVIDAQTRDNLLQILNCIGAGSKHGPIGPLAMFNGEWLHDLVWALKADVTDSQFALTAEYTGSPEWTRAEICSTFETYNKYASEM